MQSLAVSLDHVLLMFFDIFISFCLVIIAGAALLGIFIATRYSIAFMFYPRCRDCGEIARKSYTPSYIGYTGMMIAVYVSQSYALRVKVGDREVVKEVKYALYNSVKRGSEVNVLYSIEPLSQKMYLWKIWK